MDRDFTKDLDEAQNEYFGILHDVLTNDKELLGKDKGYIYWWERLKRLQKTIMNLTFMDREIALEKAKEALENAFTPRIRAMLEENMKKETEEESA